MANTIQRLRTSLAPLVERLTGDFFPNTATFYNRVNAERPSGANQYSWVRDDRLVSLPAMIETADSYMERERPSTMAGTSGLTFTTGDYVATLGKYYADIDGTMEMQDEFGTKYTVVGISTDPLRLTTIVTVRRTTPKGN